MKVVRLVIVILTSALAPCFAEEFYTNGAQIDQWDRFENRTFRDGDGASHTGYFQTYHFLRRDGDTFWFQRLAVRTFDQPKLTWYYDMATRVWVGRWDDDHAMYSRLDPPYRRHRISEIPGGAFPMPNLIPTLHDLIQKPGSPQPPNAPLMGDPPDASNFREASKDNKNIDDTTGPAPPAKPNPCVVHSQVSWVIVPCP